MAGALLVSKRSPLESLKGAVYRLPHNCHRCCWVQPCPADATSTRVAPIRRSRNRAVACALLLTHTVIIAAPGVADVLETPGLAAATALRLVASHMHAHLGACGAQTFPVAKVMSSR